MKALTTWVERQGLQVVTQPLSIPVPGQQDAYVRTEGLSKLGWRVLRRKLYLYWTGQYALLHVQANPHWKRGLWIYYRTSQIGDSLMDLSARSFFATVGCSVDLLTSPQLNQLYLNDNWFGKVTADAESIDPKDYDFVIVQSVHYRALKAKIKLFPKLPWICVQGFFDVPDFARGLWSAQRFMDLWRCPTANRNEHGRQKLSVLNCGKPSLDQDYPLVVVLGGLDPIRTYRKWANVLDQLASHGVRECVLIGTGLVAKADALDIVHRSIPMAIDNLIDQLSLHQCIQLLSRTKLLLAADGGAMHLGVAAWTNKIVGLFICGIPPELRLPVDYHVHAVVSPTGLINDISVDDVCQQAIAAGCISEVKLDGLQLTPNGGLDA